MIAPSRLENLKCLTSRFFPNFPAPPRNHSRAYANNAVKPLLSPLSIFRTKLLPVVSDVRVIWRLL